MLAGPAAAMQGITNRNRDEFLDFEIGGFFGGRYKVSGDGVELNFHSIAHTAGDEQVLNFKPSSAKWRNFWRRCEAAEVWRWPHPEGHRHSDDGGEWMLRLRHGGRQLDSSGSCDTLADDTGASRYQAWLKNLNTLLGVGHHQCPACHGSDVARILYAQPPLSTSQQKELVSGKVVLGDPGNGFDRSDRRCLNCACEWIAPVIQD